MKVSDTYLLYLTLASVVHNTYIVSKEDLVLIDILQS